MRLATSTCDFDRFCDTYLDCVKNVHQAGFSYIDLSLYRVQPNDSLLLSDHWQKTAAELKAYAEQNGISFVQSHGPNVNPLDSETAFEDAVRLTTRAIEVCGELRIPNMVMHAGWDPDASKQEWFERNRRFFRALFPAMEKHNVNVLHENTTSANMPWYYSKTGAQMREFSEFVNHPMIHSCWDTGHANVEGSQYDEIMSIGNDLFALHINDNRGKQDEHIIPFFGTLNLDEMMHALKDVGYHGYFTFESGSTLRPDQYWLGDRHVFKKDTRLANPPLFLQLELEKYMHLVGEYILKSYDMLEE